MLNSFLLQYSFSYLFSGLVYIFLAVLVFIKAPKESINRVFAVYCFSVAWWCFFSVLMINSPSEMWGTFWDRLCLMGVIFIPATFLHFNYIMLGYMQKYKWFVYVNYVIGSIFFLSNFTPLFIDHTSPKFNLNFYTEPGFLYLPFIIYFFTLSFFTFGILFFAKNNAPENKKKQFTLLFWSALLGYSLGGTNFNLSFNIGPAFIPLIGNIGSVIYAILIAFNITKYGLMDMRVIISRTIAELLSIVFLGGIYLAFVWFYVGYISNNIDWLFLTTTIMYGVVVGEVHQAFRLFIQTTSDKLFLRGKYDYYKSLSDSSSKVGEKLALPDILKVLYSTFYDVVEISNPRIYLPDNFTAADKISSEYVVYSKQDCKPDNNAQKIKIDSALVKELISKRMPIMDVKDLNAVLVIPCLLENRLIAIFVLGPKLSEEHYTDDDIRLLKVLANQAAVVLDHTRSYEKIHAELEIVERQLERSQRLASLGTLTAGVTHEIRNPLTVIRAETEGLANQPRDIEFLKTHRDLLLKHIDRISGIVQRMLQLAKEKPKEEKEIDLNEVLESTLAFFPASLAVFVKDLHPLPKIKADIEELQEVFVNLVQNAIEAMPGGGRITIKTYLDDQKKIVEITDNGKGIPEELREKIFDPFFSTRHEGTGLGLSIVYRIIRQYGGNISVSSEMGKGSTFKIVF